MVTTSITVGLVVLGIFATVWGYIKRLRKCSSEEILVVWGSGTKGKGSKIIHGGMSFVWPVIQDYKYLSLTPSQINIDLRGALSSQNIRVNVASDFMVAIDPTPGIAEKAAQHLLNSDRKKIVEFAEGIIYGQLREVIASMKIEEINSNREKFQKNVQDKVESELTKIGLMLVNVNITDITDEVGYIKSLGEEAAAEALNNARVSVSQKNKEGDIGSANNEQERRVEVAKLKAQAQVGEAEAETDRRVKIADADSVAIEGENLAKVKIASSLANRKVEEAEFMRKSVTAEKVKAAQTQEDSYKAIAKSENERAKKEEATLKANIIVPAEVAKRELVIQAQAEAERNRELSKGEADGIFYKAEAEAMGVKEMLIKQAEGFEALVKSAGGDPKIAIQMMITDKLPEMLQIQTDGLKNIDIDKITVWENGGGNGEGSSTSNFLSGLLGSMPQYKDLFEMAGTGIPQVLESSNERYIGSNPKLEDNNGEVIDTDVDSDDKGE